MNTKKKNETGFVFYSGPSQLDGAPIVGICLVGKSSNKKTGGMAQTYILRADTHPVEAVKTGQDSSICGNCPHRLINREYTDRKGRIKTGLKRTCYVNLGHGPSAVFKAYKNGNYPTVSPEWLNKLAGRKLRLGTYGDPLAIPKSAWDVLLGAGIAGHTGYTHQWQKTELSANWIGKLMASVDNALERVQAQDNGWRTFSVLQSTETYFATGSAMCPGSGEYKQKTGKIVQCERCGLCNGSKASVAIQGHGIGWVDTNRINLL